MNHTITTLGAETRTRIINRIMREHDFTLEMTTSIIDETLVYMHACDHDTLGIGPSELVDIGWHTFILYTREYAAYCERTFGHFLHHNPTDRDGEVGPPLTETIAFFEANGITYDPELWNSKCTNPDCQRSCSECSKVHPCAKCNEKSGCVGHGGSNCGTQKAELVSAGPCTSRCSTNCK